MASITNDHGGKRRLQFTDPFEGKRRTIYLGKVSHREATSIIFRVEQLLTAKITQDSVEADTAKWVASLPRVDHGLSEKLARAGLIESRETSGQSRLGLFIAGIIAANAHLKPNTQKNYRATQNRLLNYFGPDKLIESVTPADAERWRRHLLSTLSSATVSREVRRARQFFQAAVRERMIAENPFDGLPTPQQANGKRASYITQETASAVLAACPNAEWRLIFALSRYGGLRCPSEHLALKWEHIDWEHGRIDVPSPKTEHHVDGESRTIPLFPELRPHLEAVRRAAEPGGEWVITQFRKSNSNLRTQLLRILRNAGIPAWPKLFHNLRATRQTELSDDYPAHVVCRWLGNSLQVADKHYLTVPESAFRRAAGLEGASTEAGASLANAAQNAAQQAHAEGGNASQAESEEGRFPRELPGVASNCESVPKHGVPRRGVEPLSPP